MIQARWWRRLATVALTACAAVHAQATEKAGTLPEQSWATRFKVAELSLQPPTAMDPRTVQQIEQLFARFGIAYDEARMDVMETLFTPDADLEILEASAVPLVRAHGRGVVATLSNAIVQQRDQRRHLISNVTINELSEGKAAVLAYGMVTVAADGVALGASVIYTASLQRGTDARWRFAHLVIGMDGYNGRKPASRN